MEEIENPEDLVAREQERRGMPRCSVDADAALLVLSTGSETPCRIVELSLGGCRVEMRQRASFGVAAAVELTFKIQGIAFRLSGLTEWTAGKMAGLSFGPMSSRRRDELVEVLCEVEFKHAAEAAERGAETEARAASAAQRGPFLVPRPLSPGDPGASGESPAAGSESPTLETPEEQHAQAQSGLPRERRVNRRCEVDTSAIIHLVKIGSKLNGKILDLSLGGCRIQTAERFAVGIYTRVETEFRLQGLPLRLAGVIQAIHDRNLVGVRFLDVSPRKREQIAELIDEIVEMRGVGTCE
jgi:c-di-GMP-binding flagellar brake protein YcgR